MRQVLPSQAIACGVLVAGGLVDVPIARHGTDRKRMAATPGGKPAITHFRVRERFRGLELWDVVDDDGEALIHCMPARAKFLKGWWTP